MLHFLRRKKAAAPDGKYTYTLHPLPTAGAAEYVFDQEYPNPIYPLAGGPGVLTASQLRVVQHPQVMHPLSLPVIGPGGIPSPDQSFIFAGLEENPGA